VAHMRGREREGGAAESAGTKIYGATPGNGGADPSPAHGTANLDESDAVRLLPADVTPKP